MNKKCLGKVSLLLATVLALSACAGGGENSDGGNDEVVTVEQMEKDYPLIIENEGEPVDGATLKKAVISDSGFKGIMNPVFCTDAYDQAVMGGAMGGAFWVDKEMKLILNSDEAPIKVNIDKDKKLITYDINPKFKWNTGEQVTTKDIVKTYEILANQEYINAAQSPRFDKQKRVIEGIEAYNEGKADKISGLKVRDDSHMDIQLTEITPSVYWGGATVFEFVNAKSVEGVPMNKLQECDAFRKNPPSYGPYAVKDIINGEKVVYEANKYYYRGEPKVKRMEVEILPTSQVVAAIKAGKYDIVDSIPNTTFPEVKGLKNVKLMAAKSRSLGYLGFKQGKWDAAKSECITDPNAKMNDVNLKAAMGYALDMQAVGNKFYYGLSYPAQTFLSPTVENLLNPEIKPYSLNQQKANELLDKGGYKDIDGDGIREDKNGKPLNITLAMMSGGETAEPLSQYYMQQWKAIGLNVELLDGRLIEFNDFYQRLGDDDPAIDCYIAAWNIGSDPNPQELWGKRAAFNFTRYTSEKLDAAMNNVASEKALDPEYRKNAYFELEKVFREQVPAIPLSYRLEVTPINNRVKYFNATPGNLDFDLSKVELTAKEPIANN